MLVIATMTHLIFYDILMGPIRFLPGAHMMLKPALLTVIHYIVLSTSTSL